MDSLRFAKRWRGEEGAELIEFALVFPLLLLVLLGIMDFGLLFHQYEVLTNAAREGARVSVLPGYDSGSDAQVKARVDQYLLGTGLTPENVTMAPRIPTVVNLAPDLCAKVQTVQLSFVHEYTFISGIASYFGGSFGSKTLTARASMRSETPATSCSD